jgi:phosphate transport system protein
MTTSADMAQRIARLQGDLVEQGRRVLAMLEAAFDAAFARDAARAAAAEAQDDAIDAVDVAIERAAVQLLSDATRAGAAMEPSDLRAVLTIVKVNNELERIADCAVEVAGLVRRHAGTTGAYPDTFRVMANSVIGILRDTNIAVQRSDAALAKVVLQSQHAVTAFKAALLRDAEEKIARGVMQVDFAFQLHEMATECERIADHCTNIAEQVIYQTTGAIVRHTDAQWVITRPAT